MTHRDGSYRNRGHQDTINDDGDLTGGESSETTNSALAAREIDEDVEITQPFNGSWLGTINGPNR